MPSPCDTPASVERFLIEGFRSMSPAQKLECVVKLNRAVESFARAGITQRHGQNISDAEMRLRLAALRLDRRIMTEVFGWDPAVHGY
jgi:hypothetical protein